MSDPTYKKREFYNICAIQLFDFRSATVKSKNADFSGNKSIKWDDKRINDWGLKMSMNGGLDELTMEHYSAIKTNEILIYAI